VGMRCLLCHLMLQKYRMGKWSKAGNCEFVLDLDASGVEALRIQEFATGSLKWRLNGSPERLRQVIR
jgi:hypothetical protein